MGIFKLKSTKAYFSSWLTEEQLTALHDAGIPMDWDDEGVSFDASELERVLGTLHAEVLFRRPSKFKRMEEVLLSPVSHGQPEFQLRCDDHLVVTKQHARFVEMLRGTLLPLIGKHIIVHAAHGVVEPIHDGNFHVFMDATPGDGQFAELPNTLFGLPVKLSRENGCYAQSQRGMKLVARAENTCVGELVGDNLYILFDALGASGGDEMLAILLFVLRGVTQLVEADRAFERVVTRYGLSENEETSGFKQYYHGAADHLSAHVGNLIQRVLLPVVQSDITVHFDRCAPASAGDGKFHVYLRGCEYQQAVDAPATIWGVDRDEAITTDKLYYKGIPVVDEETGFVAAEVVDHSLSINFSTFVGSADYRLDLLARTLIESLNELDLERWTGALFDEFGIEADFDKSVARRHQVRMNNADCRRNDVTQMLVKHLLVPVVGRDVEVSWSGESLVAPTEPIKSRVAPFQVVFNSSLSGILAAFVPARIFGMPLAEKDQESFFEPSGSGFAIMDDEGVLVGEVVGNTLYLFGNLVLNGTWPEAKMLVRLLQKVGAELSGIAGDADYAVAQLELAVGPRARNKKVARETSETARLDLNRALTTAVAQESVLARTEALDTLGDEFDELLEIENVVNVRVEEECIVVETTVLYCTDPRTNIRHEIGAFDISLWTNGAIRWVNKTRYVGDKYAPHITTAGNACYGNTADIFPKLIGERNFAAAAMTAIAFVESVNVDDDWGRHINLWPVARKEES